MNDSIIQIAERIKGLRTLLEITTEEMSKTLSIREDEYIDCEEGKSDFTFTFLHKCAEKFGIDITELITGSTPKLTSYSVIRKDKGLSVARREGFTYQHLGYRLKNRKAEPFKVTAPFKIEEQTSPIKLSTHKGQEFNYILSGKLKIKVDGHTEILNEGDAIYYNSSQEHGMIAIDDKDCTFIAVVFKE